MIAFETYLNGEKLCVAGIGEDGTLFQNLICRKRRHPTRSAETARARQTDLRVSALVNEEHLTWFDPQLTVEIGDEIIVRIVDVERADEPTRRERSESRAERVHKVQAGLANVKSLLPSALVEGNFLASLRGCDELVAEGESEMAVKILANLGDLNGCAPEFWAALKDVAVDLQMYRMASDFHEKARQTEE